MNYEDLIKRNWKLIGEYPSGETIWIIRDIILGSKKREYIGYELILKPHSHTIKITKVWDVWEKPQARQDLFLGKCPDTETFDYICNLIF